MLADYHVHYHLDACASKEMTLDNIVAEAIRVGLHEIAILKHYSSELPNGRAQYQEYYRIVPIVFEKYLYDIITFTPLPDLMIYSGVETELISEDGLINIEPEQQERIDMVALSVHFMPYLDILNISNDNYPHILSPGTDSYLASINPWLRKIEQAGAENIIIGLVNAYCNAIRRNPKIRTLAHMMDGLEPLRLYHIAVDQVPADTLVRLMEPLMLCMLEHQVLWELHTMAPKQKAILFRANELGVRFSATADAHYITGGWANISDHGKAEKIIDNLSLNRGNIY